MSGQEGAKVYIQDAAGGWIRATVLSALGNSLYRVQKEPWEDEVGAAATEPLEVDASKMEGGMLPFQNANMPDSGFPNMTTLDHLHEAALLHNLRRRFFAGGCPYTYTADIIIALNPYRWYPELYTDDVRKEYLVFDKGKLPPHAYATSSDAYSNLQETKQDQAILVSGESGAGKTETVKILMGHLAMIASSDDTSHIKRIVESNPLLESFGNAQTIRNDNSSRFGKFIELELGESCRLVGSKCRTYLLEKNRVVSQDAGERNYHIFYQMLAAPAEQKANFGLESASHMRDKMLYTRLGNSPIDHIEGKSDAECFDKTVSALALVGVDGDVLKTLMRALAGVLLLGQLAFDKTSDDGSKFGAETDEDAKNAAAVLDVDVNKLEKALTRRTIKTRNESFSKPLSKEQAEGSRDGISKELYSRAFDWLVTKICAATGSSVQSDVKHFIGLLDIFGFECFDINRFPQICINYANEKLQQKFTLDVFKTVQQEYSEEGIPWDRIEFKDNAPLLALIEAKLGIIAMLNEECVRPKGAEEIFVSKLVSVHKDDPAFSVPKIGKVKEFQFTIKHYAGSVTYTTHDWLDRNRDAVSDDLIELMQESGNSLIASIFTPEKVEAEVQAQGKATKAETVATKFKSSLAQLMETIGRTKTQYVRCIKPNKNKSPVEMNDPMVVEQLRCAGVIEAIKVSRAGFPARMPLKEFVHRFAVLVRAAAGQLGARLAKSCQAGSQAQMKAVLDAMSRQAEAQEICRALMSALSTSEDKNYEIGRTRVYFKAGVMEKLEEQRALLMQAAATEIVRCARGWLSRRRFQRLRKAALKLQANIRMKRARATYLVERRMAVRCQARRRSTLARRRVAVLRRVRAATRLQTWHRKLVALHEFRQARQAAVRIQSLVRKRNCQREYVEKLREFKESAKLENQVKALQERLAAAERAAQSGTAVPGAAAEPSGDILEALQALATENQKLRVDLDRVKGENVKLREENHSLRAGASKRDDWFSFAALGSKSKKPVTSFSAGPRSPSSTADEDSIDFDTESKLPAEQTALGEARVPTMPALKALRHYTSLNEFWEDVPCAGVQVLKRGSEMHLKVGPNIIMVEAEHKKHLIWRPWMHDQDGYLRSMGFLIERHKEKRSVMHRTSVTLGGLLGPGKGPEDKPQIPDHDVCVGTAFCLRSTQTRMYVSVGGMFDRCLQVTAEKAHDAAIFTIVPMPNQAAAAVAAGGQMSDADYCFALRLQGENKYLSLRKDGYVQTSSLTDDTSANIVNDTMAASLEYLVPCNSYEITVQEVQIGLTVGKDLPLRVVGFSQVNKDGRQQPGPAERTGRVRLYDIITHVNGQDIAGIPRKDVLSMIACKRPITLGFWTEVPVYKS